MTLLVNLVLAKSAIAFAATAALSPLQKSLTITATSKQL
jgi:hypothetical protein